MNLENINQLIREIEDLKVSELKDQDICDTLTKLALILNDTLHLFRRPRGYWGNTPINVKQKINSLRKSKLLKELKND